MITTLDFNKVNGKDDFEDNREGDRDDNSKNEGEDGWRRLQPLHRVPTERHRTDSVQGNHLTGETYQMM